MKPSIALKIAILLALLGLAAACLTPALYRPRGVRPVALELSLIANALYAYHEKFGSFPSGTTAGAICKALSGENAGAIQFVNWPPGRRDAQGALADPWGTPYRFYFAGNTALIRCAGPDRKFDDSVSAKADDLYLEVNVSAPK